MSQFNFKKNATPNALETAIDNVLATMSDNNPSSEEYHKMVDQLDKLYKMKASEKPDRVKFDTWVAVGGNLLGLVLIIRHEQFNVITSKALGFVLKSKIL